MEEAEQQPEKQEQVRDTIVARFAETLTDTVADFEQEQGLESTGETARDLIYTFIEEEISNAKMYTSEKESVTFPYTMIDIGELSKKLYMRYADMLPELHPDPENTPAASKEFIFQSFLSTENGHIFTFFEEAFHELIKKLRTALEKIKNGQEPDHDEVYTVGSPTNVLGTVSEDFVKKTKEGKAFDAFGDLYAEFVQTQLPQSEEGQNSIPVELFGISIGGSIATKTAERLLAEGSVSQSPEDEEDVTDRSKPRLSVHVDTLPGGSESKNKQWQIPLGFAVDAVYTQLADPYTRATVGGEHDFIESVNAILAKRGFEIHMDPEQAELKKEIMWGKKPLIGNDGLINSLRNGVPVAEDLKLTETRSIFDMLQYEDAFRRSALKQERDHPDSLGTHIVDSKGNRRVAAISKGHTMAFMRDNELQRIHKAAEALNSLKK